MMLRCLAFVAVASLASAATPRVPNIAGDYTSNWDDVRLDQQGTRVHGTYVCCGGGTIEGRIIEGRIIRYHWAEPNGAGGGEGIWKILSSGRLEGTWGNGQSATDGGPWNLVPKPALAN